MTVIVRLRVCEIHAGLRQVSSASVGFARSFAMAVTIAALCTTAIGVEILPAVRTAPSHTDARAERLAAFFAAYNCPPPHYVEDYLRAADRYGLDYRLLPAISVRETTCGSTEVNNNRWGYHPGRQSFPSVRTGIEFLARQLALNPPYAGKALKDKLWTYNPKPAYPDEVQRIMRRIE